MNAGATDLLAALGGVVSNARIAGIDGGLTAGMLEAGNFGDLLARVTRGDHSTGRAIVDSASLGLSQDQLGKIGAATDRAEASGMERALVLLDGKAYEVNVQSRTVVGERRLDELGAISGIDGIVDAGGGELRASPPEPGPVGLGMLTATNGTLADMLVRREESVEGKEG
ncbi:MAG: hypothetical protein AAGB51_00375 [Planctomycetota bacterium]